jgi:hypothetical protein
MAIGDPYIDAEQLKSVMGITNSDEDVLIERAVRGATRAIERKSAYATFWNTVTPVARVVPVHRRIVPVRQYGYYKLLLPDGILGTNLVVSDNLGATAILPDRTGDPITELKLTRAPSGDVTVTDVWGWPEVPDDIIMATQFQAQRYYKRRGSPEGLAGSAEWGTVRIPRLDPDVAAILENGGYLNPGVG